MASGPNHRAGGRQANAGASGSSRTSAGKGGVSEIVAAPRESLIDPYVAGVRILQEQSSPVSWISPLSSLEWEEPVYHVTKSGKSRDEEELVARPQESFYLWRSSW